MWDDDELDDMTQKTIILGGGGVEYDMSKAVCPIQELIDSLLEAQRDGAEYVVQSSGNYRGAKWASVNGDYAWANDC